MRASRLAASALLLRTRSGSASGLKATAAERRNLSVRRASRRSGSTRSLGDEDREPRPTTSRRLLSHERRRLAEAATYSRSRRGGANVRRGLATTPGARQSRCSHSSASPSATRRCYVPFRKGGCCCRPLSCACSTGTGEVTAADRRAVALLLSCRGVPLLPCAVTDHGTRRSDSGRPECCSREKGGVRSQLGGAPGPRPTQASGQHARVRYRTIVCATARGAGRKCRSAGERSSDHGRRARGGRWACR